MTRAATRLRAGAVLALIAASPAGAGSWAASAAASGGFTLINDWSPTGATMTPTFDVDTEASFGGSPFKAGLFSFGVTGRFRTRRTQYAQGHTASNLFGFRLNVSALAETPFPVRFYASRDWGDFLSNLTLLQTGATTTTSFGGSVQLRAVRYPSVRLAVNRTVIETESFGSPQTFAGATTLSAGLGYSLGNQTYEATYDTGWNNGTFAQNNYQSHAIGLAVSARPSKELMLRFSDRYYLRLPLIEAPTNPRYDDNALTVGVSRPSDQVNLGADYSYRRLLVTAAQTPDMEQTDHGANAQANFRYTPNLNLNGNVRALVHLQRLGTTVMTGANQGLGVGFGWRGKVGERWAFTAGAGLSGGLSEPAAGEVLFAWGVNASGGVTVNLDWLQANLDYSIDHQRNMLGLVGWTLTQRGTLNGSALLRGVLLRTLLTAAGARRDDPLFGTMLSRSLTLVQSVTWRVFEATLGAGFGEGLTAALTNPGFVDGLFLPAPYNTMTRYANLGLSARLFNNSLALGLMGRTLASTSPGRPDQWEHGAMLTVGYTIGAFTVTLEERLSVGGTGPFTQASNLLMVRVSRGFGWNF